MEASYATSFSGPLPSPEILERYEQLVPGAASSLFEDFHKNSQHIRDLERFAVERAVSKDKRAQWMAYTLVGGMTLLGLAAAKWIAISLGVAIVVTSMPVTIGAFLKRNDK
jgi:uncharacterized membrane protein